MTWKYKAQQNEGELREFVNLLKSENITSYLEIGCKWGGTLYRVAKTMPIGSKIVAVDLPEQGKGTLSSLKACADELHRMGYLVDLIIGDSTRNDIVQTVKGLGPFDACLIDGDHTLPGVTADWENYGPLARIVAFHDISWKRPTDPSRTEIQVPGFWKKLKPGYRHVEIQHEPMDNGFGILFRNNPILQVGNSHG